MEIESIHILWGSVIIPTISFLVVWNLKTGKCVRTFKHRYIVHSVSVGSFILRTILVNLLHSAI